MYVQIVSLEAAAFSMFSYYANFFVLLQYASCTTEILEAKV